ncbi:hypothetical protein [Salinicola tamaricis]|uniref:hypothetical protein n=1 Tax=Salinicola tamaricis TaxID=1771309 RepID=UPI00101AE7B1|nr:hypothetical protein [Salinicola tamaricis]
MDESKRIKKLRREMVNVIPKFPNNLKTKEKLEQESLTTLLVHYLNWVSRYISVKPRRITIEPTVTSDSRWKALKSNVEALLAKAHDGENLCPNLSIQPSTRGYTPAASEKGPDVDRWEDKDLLLNAMGFHHFHLGTKIEAAGYAERTDELLFARVTREEFVAIGIFDHTVFEPTGDDMSVERKRLWEMFGENTTCGVPPGSVVMPSPIATSGHPIHLVSTAQEYARFIREIDPKLDDRDFVEGLYQDACFEKPKSPNLSWALNFSDLGIHEKKSNHLFVVRRGFN